MRLLNELLENESFLVDKESIPYIVRDIINMNWWNTCGYLRGYKKNKRVSLEFPDREMKLIALILKEFYRHDKQNMRDPHKLKSELAGYINGTRKSLQQLKYYSTEYRRNDSQYYYKDGNPTWLDCTSRATYAWKYVAQNGYIDFDGVCRVKDGSKIIKHCNNSSVYPNKPEIAALFSEGENQVKKEIFSQRENQLTVAEWVINLGINVKESRIWLYKLISQVRTDPYKNYEKKLFKEGNLTGNNELLYGYLTSASSASDASSASSASVARAASDASSASRASAASSASAASHASHASDASHASRASDASHASRASSASRASAASHASAASDAGVISTQEKENWYNVQAALGEVQGLQHPPYFEKNKFGLAGHWKINPSLIDDCKLAFIDPFMGHGETPLYAKKVGKNFVGIELNPDSMNGYLLPFVQEAVNNEGDRSVNVELRLGDSSIFYPDLEGKFDLCYTSPPYFKFEDYGFHNKVIQSCNSYDEYHEKVTVPVFSNVYKYLIEGGVLALQVEKNKKNKLKWIDVILGLGFELMTDTVTGQERIKYSRMSKRDQNLIIFKKLEK